MTHPEKYGCKLQTPPSWNSDVSHKIIKHREIFIWVTLRNSELFVKCRALLPLTTTARDKQVIGALIHRTDQNIELLVEHKMHRFINLSI